MSETTADVCPRCGEHAIERGMDCGRKDTEHFVCANDHRWPIYTLADGEPIEPADDQVLRPSHYCQGPIECRHAIASAITGLVGVEAHLTANVIERMWRWKHKDGLQDLLKAKREIEMLVETLEGK